MSDSPFTPASDALKERHARRLELYHYVAKDTFAFWWSVANWLAHEPKSMNLGNQERTMKQYLREWARAGYGGFDGDYFLVNDRGRAYLQEEYRRWSGWLKWLHYLDEKFEKIKGSLQGKKDTPLFVKEEDDKK